MTARVWEGKTRSEHGEIYTKIIEDRDIPNYRKTNGFVKLTFLKHSDDAITYFKLLTFWTDVDAVKNFTGPNFEVAVGYQEDEQYLVDFPGKVQHYEVFAD